MITDKDFWRNIVNSWISVQSSEDKQKTLTFAETLALKQLNSRLKKVDSIYDELFGEER